MRNSIGASDLPVSVLADIRGDAGERDDLGLQVERRGVSETLRKSYSHIKRHGDNC